GLAAICAEPNVQPPLDGGTADLPVLGSWLRLAVHPSAGSPPRRCHRRAPASASTPVWRLAAPARPSASRSSLANRTQPPRRRRLDRSILKHPCPFQILF